MLQEQQKTPCNFRAKIKHLSLQHYFRSQIISFAKESKSSLITQKNLKFTIKTYLRFATVMITVLLVLSCNEESSEPDKEEWVALFNGSNYDDWTPKFVGYELGVNHKDRFVYEDSLLSVRYAKTDTFNGNFGHLFYKEKF